MQISYGPIAYKGYNSYFTVDEPSVCPICKHSLKPTLLYRDVIQNNNGASFLYSSYLCTHCHEMFVCKFSDLHEIKDHKYTFNNLDLIAPNKFEKVSFNKYIENVSPNFVKIYNQALEAEHNKLDEIAGIGYRKALEFLVKDFLIKHDGKNEEKVKSTNLGVCINTMIENPQLKIAASRATWLGNDQTHYEQKYTDKNINDLKKLIKLSVNWIEMIYLTDEAEDIEKK